MQSTTNIRRKCRKCDGKGKTKDGKTCPACLGKRTSGIHTK